METNQPGSEELPKTWTKDFYISSSYTGSMSGSWDKTRITYDSCHYEGYDRNNGPKNITFAMNEEMRSSLLKKMHELKVTSINSKSKMVAVRDGWTNTLCFSSNCISSGPQYTVTGEERFQQAMAVINDFVTNRGKK